MFPTLTALIQYYGKKKQKGMPCKLDLVGLAIDVAEHDREREPAIVNPGYMSPGSEAGQPRERVDSLFTDAGGDARLQRGKSGAGATTVRSSIHNNPGYKGAGKTTTGVCRHATLSRLAPNAQDQSALAAFGHAAARFG